MASTDKLIPEWLNADSFTDLMQKKFASFDKIIKFTARSAMPPGENYSSLMIRVNIEVALKNDNVNHQNNNIEKSNSGSFMCCKSSKKSNNNEIPNNTAVQTEHISFMIKVVHDNEMMREYLKIVNTFHTESNLLINLLPQFENLFKSAGVDVRFGSRAYILPKYPDGSYVLMDDLGMNGYKCANRMECLDMDHVHLVLKKLAQYHAASATYKVKNGPFADHYMKGLNTEFNKANMGQIMNGFKDGFLKNVDLYRDGKKYAPAVAKYFETLDSHFTTLFGYDDNNGFNALSHGDCWTSNMLFKYSTNGQVEDIRFVDFQLSSWGSPIKDVTYFLISSVKNDIKLKNFDYYLRFYHEHLAASLKLLKYPNEIPTLRWLHMQSYKYGGCATMASMLTLPIVLNDSSKDSNTDNITGASEAAVQFKAKMFANPRYVKHINDLLPWLHDRGCFNDTY